MKHAQYKEWLHLSALGELNDDARRLLDAHLGGCAECRDELKELLKFQSVIARNPLAEVTERTLMEARQQLRLSLLEYRLWKPFSERAADWAQDFIVRTYKIAFGGIAMAALGVVVGYLIFFRPQIAEEKAPRIELPAVEQAVQSNSGSESFTQGTQERRTSILSMREGRTGWSSSHSWP